MHRHPGKRFGLFSALLLLLVVAGFALATGLSSGTGLAADESTVPVNSVISPASPGKALYPGGWTTYTVTISNPYPYPVVVEGISRATSGAIGRCTAGTVTSARVYRPAGVIAPSSSRAYTLAARMIANPSNTCQGRTFVMALSARLATVPG